MAAVRHLGFVKFEFFNGLAVKRPILHQHTEFRKDRSNRYGDIAIFVIFQDGGRRHFGFNFQKFEILTVDPLYEANMRHCTKSYQNRSNGCRDIVI